MLLYHSTNEFLNCERSLLEGRIWNEIKKSLKDTGNLSVTQNIKSKEYSVSTKVYVKATKIDA